MFITINGQRRYCSRNFIKVNKENLDENSALKIALPPSRCIYLCTDNNFQGKIYVVRKSPGKNLRKQRAILDTSQT